ncbi:MAG: hypothetical protein QOG82_2903 [Actinomycetota bacterium]|jgi:hypothetical protein|nr:hypothetical protein [Actinomycetota bacterium]
MSDVRTTKLDLANPEVEAYLAAVRDELGHLSEAERGDLLDDLALHLAEVAGDEGDDGGPTGLVARLGPPARYAAELRAAAGLPAPPDVGSRPGSVTSTGLRDAVVGSRAGRLAKSAWRHPWTGETRAYVRQLTPAWWVLRGYLVVAVLAWGGTNGADSFPVPSVAGSWFLGVVSVAGAVAVSIAVGRRTTRRGSRWLVGALDVVLALAAIGALGNVGGDLDQVTYISGPDQAGYELSSPFGPVTNIYPYSRDGRPLDDVLLFDQDGRPLRAAFQEWWPDGCVRIVEYPTAADGVAVEFAYPQRYSLLPQGPVRFGGPPCTPTPARPPVPLPAFPAP